MVEVVRHPPPAAPVTAPQLLLWAREVSHYLEQFLGVRALAFESGSVTLTANQATTAVTGHNGTASSRVFLFPTTANGAAELGAGTLYVSAKATGSFTLTHANNAQTDRTFDFLLMHLRSS